MKTAMQELIEWVENNTIAIILNTDVVKQKAIELLEKEKKQIIEAYDEGKEYEYQYHINCDPVKYEDVKTSEKYYKETFKD